MARLLTSDMPAPILVARHSLDGLMSIVQHPRLGSAMKELWLGSHYLDDDDLSEHFPEELANSESDDERLRITKLQQRYRHYLSAQNTFRTGDDVAALTAILSHMKGLQNIRLGEWCCGTTSGPEDEARCYGMRTVERETSQRYLVRVEPFGNCRVTGLTHNFKVLLRALALTRKPIKELTALCWLDHRDMSPEHYPINMHALLPLVSYFRDGLRVAFATLSTLSLAGSFHTWAEDEEIETDWKQYLPRFLELAPHLQFLSLTIDGWPHNGMCEGQGENTYGFAGLAAHACIPHLTSLELRFVEVTWRDFYYFCKSVGRNIVDLKLHQIQLKEGTANWSSLLTTTIEWQLFSV